MSEMHLLLIDVCIDPIFFNIGSFEVGWHGLMVVLAVITGIATSMWFARGTSITKEDIIGFAPWAVLGGIIGARLFHVIDCYSLYGDNPARIFEFWHGLSILGAILGGTLAAVIYTRITHKQLGHIADVIAPALLLAVAVGRIGCTINGDAFGRETSLPWAFVYCDLPGIYAPVGVPTHPSPVYEIFWCLIAFAVIWQLRDKLKPEGTLFLVYLILYFFGRFLIEFTRGVSEAGVDIGGWHTPHFISLVTLAICIPLLILRIKKAGRSTNGDEVEDVEL